MFAHSVRVASTAALLLVGIALATDGGSYCPVENALLFPQDCAKPITGCICTGSYSGSAYSYPDCEGCWMDITMTYSCTFPYGQGREGCFMQMACDGGTATCDRSCPCTREPWFSFVSTCGSCN